MNPAGIYAEKNGHSVAAFVLSQFVLSKLKLLLHLSESVCNAVGQCSCDLLARDDQCGRNNGWPVMISDRRLGILFSHIDWNLGCNCFAAWAVMHEYCGAQNH